MTRLFVFAFLSISLVAPAAAQVINGETPLDETTLNRETPGPVDQAGAAPRPSPPPADEPARRDLPQTAPRRH